MRRAAIAFLLLAAASQVSAPLQCSCMPCPSESARGTCQRPEPKRCCGGTAPEPAPCSCTHFDTVDRDVPPTSDSAPQTISTLPVPSLLSVVAAAIESNGPVATESPPRPRLRRHLLLRTLRC